MSTDVVRVVGVVRWAGAGALALVLCAAVQGCRSEGPASSSAGPSARWPREQTARRAPAQRPQAPRSAAADAVWIEIASREEGFLRPGVTSPPPDDVEELTAWDAVALARAAGDGLRGRLSRPVELRGVANRTRAHFDMAVLDALLAAELTRVGARVGAGPLDPPATPGVDRAPADAAAAPTPCDRLTGALSAAPDGDLILELWLDAAAPLEAGKVAPRGRDAGARPVIRLGVRALREAGARARAPYVRASELDADALRASADALVVRVRDDELPRGLRVVVDNRSTSHVAPEFLGELLAGRVATAFDLGLDESARAGLVLEATLLDLELPRPDGRPVGRVDPLGRRLHLVSLRLVRAAAREVIAAAVTWVAAPD